LLSIDARGNVRYVDIAQILVCCAYCLKERPAAVARPVEYDHHLQIRVVLPQEQRNQCLQVGLLVVRTDHYCRRRGVAFPLIPRSGKCPQKSEEINNLDTQGGEQEKKQQ